MDPILLKSSMFGFRGSQKRSQFLPRFRHPLAFLIQWFAIIGLLLQPVPLSFADDANLLDSDGDGMPDAWEQAHGLNPGDLTDAFQDQDGDRVPNLWEYQGGTDPSNISSTPPPEIIVDGSQPTDATQGRYATLQEAYDASAIESEDGLSWHYGYIAVRPGVYTAGVNGSMVPKKLLWLADVGGQVVIQCTGAAMIIAEEAVVDGFTIVGGSGGGPGIVVPSTPGGLAPEIRIVNSIISGCDATSDPDWNGAGGVINNGADLWLVQNTLVGNHGTAADAVLNQSGTIRLLNSVVGWQVAGSSSPAVSDMCAGLTVTSSIITGMGGAFNSWSDDPMLSVKGGHLTALSTSCLQRGVSTGLGVIVDIHGQPLSSSFPDLGAEQWVSTTGTGLPDWYAQRMVAAGMAGSISSVNPAWDYSGNGYSAMQEFQRGVLPGQTPFAGQAADAYALYFNSDRPALTAGQTATLSAQLVNVTRGIPVAGASVVFTTTAGDGTVDNTTLTTAVTDGSGTCYALYTGGSSEGGSQVSVQDLNGFGATASLNLLKDSYYLQLWPDKNPFSIEEHVTIFASLISTVTNTAYTGPAPLYFSSDVGSLDSTVAYADNTSGTYAVGFGCSTVGQATIHVWDGSGLGIDGGTTLQVFDDSQPPPDTYGLQLWAEQTTIYQGQSTTVHARIMRTNTGEVMTGALPLNFIVASGSGSLNVSTVYPDDGGTYSISYSSGDYGMVQINAWDGSVYQISNSCTIEVLWADNSGGGGDTGQQDGIVYNLSLWADQTFLTPGQTTNLYAHLNVPQAGVPINFSVSSGNGYLTTISTTTDTDGMAVVTFTGGYTDSQVYVSDGWGLAPPNTIGFGADNGIPNTYALGIQSDYNALAQGGTTNVYATLLDTTTGAPSPMPGVDIYFEISAGDGSLSSNIATTNNEGIATIVLTGGSSLTQINAYDLNVYNTRASLVVTVIAPTYALSLSALNTTLVPGASTMITAQLTADGSPMGSGHLLSSTVTEGDGIVATSPFGQTSIDLVTDENGCVTFPFLSGYLNSTISIWDDTGMGANTTLTINVNQISTSDNYVLNTWSEKTLLAPGESTTVHAQLIDTNTSSPVVGVPLWFTVYSPADASLAGALNSNASNFTTCVTGPDGTCQVTYTGGSNDGLLGIGDSYNLGLSTECFFGLQDEQFILTLNSSSPQLNQGDLATIYAFVSNSAGGQPIEGMALNFTVSNGNGTLDKFTGTTDANGQATVSFTGGTVASTITVTDARSLNLTSTLQQDVISTYGIILRPDHARLNPGDTTMVRAQMLNLTSGEPLSDSVINFSIGSDSDGTFSDGSTATTLNTDSQGRCAVAFTAGSTPTTISAFDNGTFGISASCGIVVVVGPTYSLSLSVATSPLAAGASTTISALLVDDNDVVVDGAPINFSVYGNGVISASSATTNSSGVCSITFTGGNSQSQINAFDAAGYGTAAACTIAVAVYTPPPPPPLAISTTTLPGGNVGSNYTATITAVNGTSPYTFSISSGSLPAGFTLSGNGVLTGLGDGPEAIADTYNFTVQVHDSSNKTASRQLSLVLGPVLIGGPDDDFDHDGLSNAEELALGTDPRSWDTDGDGISDGLEMSEGTDAKNPSSNSASLIALTFRSPVE